VSAWIAGALSIIGWSRRSRLWLGCSVFMLWWILFLFVEIFPTCRELEDVICWHIWPWHMYCWRCMIYIRCDCWNIFIYACLLLFGWDVASISWIFVIFTCFIALIEIGRYTYFLLTLVIQRFLQLSYLILESQEIFWSHYNLIAPEFMGNSYNLIWKSEFKYADTLNIH
jgi:hypothetical protein